MSYSIIVHVLQFNARIYNLHYFPLLLLIRPKYNAEGGAKYLLQLHYNTIPHYKYTHQIHALEHLCEHHVVMSLSSRGPNDAKHKNGAEGVR